MWALGVEKLQDVTNKLWKLIDGLRAGANETRIVSGSKALHHILPDLIPPIDREYTLRFFYGHTALKGNGEEEFMEIYPYFQEIALSRRAET